MLKKYSLNISIKEIIDTLNEGVIIKLGDDNYLIYTFIPATNGNNPITREEIIIPDTKVPSFYNKYSICKFDEFINKSNFRISKINLPKIEEYPAILTLSDGMQIGTILKSKIHSREINGLARSEKIIDLIRTSNEFRKYLNHEVKKSYVVNIQPCEKLEADKELIDIKRYN